MSAMTGIWDLRAMAGSASASSWLGQATRTMSQPVAVSSAICWSVALTSEVSVVVIDWTEIGESLPTPTEPTLIWRVLRRGARTGGGRAGMPSETEEPTAVMAPSYGRGRRIPAPTASGRQPPGSAQVQGYDEVGHDQDHAHHEHREAHDVGDRQQLGDVDVTGVGTTAEPGDAALEALVEGAGDVAAVERQQRHEVEHADEEVEARDQEEQRDELVGQRKRIARGGLACEPAATDDRDRAGRVALLEPDDRAADLVDLDRQLGQG